MDAKDIPYPVEQEPGIGLKADAFLETQRRRQDRHISHARRVELQNLARQLAMTVLERTKANERCLLRQMVEQLMPGEE